MLRTGQFLLTQACCCCYMIHCTTLAGLHCKDIGLLVTIYHKFYISTFKYFTELHVVGEGYCHSAASATTEVEAHMAAYYALYSY